MAWKIVSIMSVLCVVGCLSVFAEGEIGSRFAKNDVVKVYIVSITDESAQAQVLPEAFKKSVEKSLANRRSMTFQVVGTPDESHVQVRGVIKNFAYMEKGPMKLSPSVGTLALDAMATATENYVEMAAEFTVVDTKTGQELWRGVVSDYIKQKMTPEESVPLIHDKISRGFVAKCFGKPK